MDAPIATVIERSGPDALVRVDAPVCARCAAGRGCGAGVFASARSGTTLRVAVDAGLSVSVGQRVTLALGESSLMRAALYLYGAPLLGLLLGAGISQAVLQSANDTVSLAAGAAGLAVGACAGAVLSRRDACMADIRPSIASCLDSADNRRSQ
jgi:sigma-E factor negative regulatory protein RseC